MHKSSVPLSKNLLVGLLNSGWVAITGLIAIPFYIKYLGIEAYGLIGFFLTTQALFQLFDMGLAPTINREVARCSASNCMHEARRLLHSLSIIYCVMAVGIAISIIALAPLISEYWLQSKNISQDSISTAIKLMGLVIACRWPIGLYQGALMGAQRLTISSSINIVMVTLGNLGAIAILAFVSPTIEAFFIWQACIGIVYVMTIQKMTWKVIGKEVTNKFDIKGLKRIWRFSVGMSAVGLSGIIFTQLDKVILSKLLGLQEFGEYMIATVVVSTLYLLVTPFFNVIYPRFSALIASGNIEGLVTLYRMSARFMASILFPIAMFLFILAQELVFLWTGSEAIALRVGPLVGLLAVGSALHGVMHFPYALQLSYGMSRLPLTINSILIVIFIPLIIILISKYGVIGGAIAWLVLHVLYVVIGTQVTHMYLLKEIRCVWLFKDIGIPLLLSSSFGAFGYYVLDKCGQDIYLRLIFGGLLVVVVFLISVMTSKTTRTAIENSFIWKKRDRVRR